ncbi:MAG: hypothetical protein HC833_15005 [Leptolyngbyaceae cyanobacterium RM1_406_9]|nr:hypothetical protein [Leptolyngbyaceae cyanobacterium RM1_406_9]
MTETTVDSLPVAQLPNRYSIARSVLYGRLSELKIETEKRGNKAYVNAQQVDLLDRLHSHIQAGGTTAEFLVSVGLSDRQELGQPRRSAGQSDGQLATVEQSAMLAVLMEAISSRYPQGVVSRTHPDPDPLANLEALEKACRHGWQLSTSQLAQLLGLKTLSGKTIQRYGFTFTRVGRNGPESAWAITKTH